MTGILLKEIDSLRSRCDTFEAERNSLVKERDNAVQEYARLQLKRWAAEYGRDDMRKERDEARQWARKFKAQLEEPLTLCTRDGAIFCPSRPDTCEPWPCFQNLRKENIALRAQLADALFHRDKNYQELLREMGRGDKFEDERNDLSAKLEDQYEIARGEYKENSQLRGRLNKMKATWMEGLGLWKRMRTMIEQQRDRADAENADLRAQLAEARNKALDEAMSLVEYRKSTGGVSYNSYACILDSINELKDNARAYPADEISTVDS